MLRFTDKKKRVIRKKHVPDIPIIGSVMPINTGIKNMVDSKVVTQNIFSIV
jgi:hypothetical protein